MVNSKKSQKSRPRRKLASSPEAPTSGHSLAIPLNAFLAEHLKPKSGLLLALSGGLDSCVLLHLLAEAKSHILFELHAMHVHHSLSPNADKWADFCSQQCQQLQIPLQIVRLDIDKNSSLGVEAAARALRYEALFKHQSKVDCLDFVVTAHHQDDQAETLLLQLFRGAGIKGLSAMANVDHTTRLLRPLLNVPRAALSDYAKHYDIEWCEDESNNNTHYERNFVRHEVMPVLEARYPAIKSVIARTAAHIAEANHLLDSLAALDAESLLKDNSLCLQGLRLLDPARAKNCLRWWFAQNQLLMPSAEHLNEVMGQLLDAKPDANLSIQLTSKLLIDNQPQCLTLRRFQNRAYLNSQIINTQPMEAYDLVWNGETQLMLPNGSQLEFKQVIGKGIALKLGINKLRITNRQGGERFKPHAVRPTRTLKYLMQEAHIPPWQREQLPLIYWDDTLAYVPGIGIAHELQASANEQGLEIMWRNVLASNVIS
ncbi:MAG: tRNA lysidine(34) synthetase TilS [Methylotenera sp.]|nr:tRNA lysidine(34) synthetase TilS [Methylotenera sp.]